MGAVSDRGGVYPLLKESQNGTDLQDYSRQVVVPPVLNTDNEQSELGGEWTDNFRRGCIDQTTTEPHSTWESPADTNIGPLGSVFRNFMGGFDVPLKERGWEISMHTLVIILMRSFLDLSLVNFTYMCLWMPTMVTTS